MYAVRSLDVENDDHQAADAEKRYSVRIDQGGKPIDRVHTERITKVEEKVMEWDNATHIHAWFKNNVRGEMSRLRIQSCLVTEDRLVELLSVCEKVLNASHLVPRKTFAGAINIWSAPDSNALRKTGQVIKNVNVAHKLLPIPPKFNDGDLEYDDEYLKQVERTRSWILTMFADRQDGVRGDIYYYSSSRW